MAVKTLRISHPAFFGIKTAETLRFYTRTLGMEMVLRQPSFDDPDIEHFFFHAGNDNFIAYFLPRDEERAAARYQRARPGYGALNHLALDVDSVNFVEAQERLRAAGVHVIGPVDRGYERSLYFRDPNGVRIELLVWHTAPPADLRQSDVLRAAQRLRVARGAEVVEERDVRAAIASLRVATVQPARS